MDVGGGFPSGELTRNTIDALEITRDDPLGYKVFAEPGRHFSAQTFYLLTRVLGKRLKSGMPCFHLNESVYHSFNCNLMDGVSFEGSKDQFYGKVENSNNVSLAEMETSKLFGMTCDGLDIIAKSLDAPK